MILTLSRDQLLRRNLGPCKTSGASVVTAPSLFFFK